MEKKLKYEIKYALDLKLIENDIYLYQLKIKYISDVNKVKDDYHIGISKLEDIKKFMNNVEINDVPPNIARNRFELYNIDFNTINVKTLVNYY